jgi:cysteine desulfuration protein SufE
MAGLRDGLAKYEYLVALGKELEVGGERVRRDEHLLTGCQARVWLSAEITHGIMRISADSDALINRGIVALLLRVLNGRPPGEILDSDLFFLDRTGLATHLSPARSNGLAAMVRRIRELAAAELPETADHRSDRSGAAAPNLRRN